MALDFLKLHDKNLSKSYHARPQKDQTPKRRNTVIAGIDRALASLKNGEDKPTRGWYNVRGETAKLQLKHGNRALTINGENEFFVPRERATDFYNHARKSVAAGEMDSHINALFDKASGEAAATKRTRAKRGPMSPEKLAERNAKRAATLAAKKKKK